MLCKGQVHNHDRRDSEAGEVDKRRRRDYMTQERAGKKKGKKKKKKKKEKKKGKKKKKKKKEKKKG